MKAAILVGGYGTRMRPLTYVVPKCMLPIGGEPLIQRTLKYLKGYGIQEFVLCVAYLKKQIIDYLGDGSRLGVRIDYAETEFPLGTGGQLKVAERFIGDTFLAMNGDIVTSLNIANLINAHDTKSAFVTLALKRFEVKIPYGHIDLGGDSRITDFQEKPTLRYTANAGVYILDPEIFDSMPSNKLYSLETDVFPSLIKTGKELHGYYEDAYWADVGSLGDFERVDNELLTEQKAKLEYQRNQSVIASRY